MKVLLVFAKTIVQCRKFCGQRLQKIWLSRKSFESYW